MILIYSKVSNQMVFIRMQASFLKDNTLTRYTVLQTDVAWIGCSLDVCWDAFASPFGFRTIPK